MSVFTCIAILSSFDLSIDYRHSNKVLIAGSRACRYHDYAAKNSKVSLPSHDLLMLSYLEHLDYRQNIHH